MPDLTAKRTLVKSPPELWEELSEIERLAKHLDAFGEIRITKLEPEHTVAWEGEHASGTVSIEPSGWGTKVILTAELPEAEPPVEEPPEDVPEAEPPPVEEPQVEEPQVEEPQVEEARVEDLPPVQQEQPPEPRVILAPVQPAAVPKPTAKRRRGFWAWLFRDRTEKVLTQPPLMARPLTAPPIARRPEPEPAPAVVVEPAPPAVEPEPVEPDPVEPDPVEPEPVVPAAVDQEPAEPETAEPTDVNGLAPDDARAALDGMLDALGSAHHRPFSRG